MSVTQARAVLPEVIDRVLDGDEVTITRHGRPVAVVVRPDVLRARRAEPAFAGAARLRDVLERARQERPPGAGLSVPRAEELVEQIRADRDSDSWTPSTPTS